MKKFKKIFAVLLTLAMVMGMSMTTFAAPKTSATITVTNAENANLSMVQVIAPDQTPASETGWKFVNGAGAAYVSALKAANEQQAIWMLIKYADADAVVPNGIKAATAGQINIALSNVTGHTAFTNGTAVNTAGVYAIRATETGFTYNDMAAYIGFSEMAGNEYPSLTDASLAAKKTPTTVVKDNNDDDNVVQIGDIITYTVEAYVPYINPTDSNKTFYVYDNIEGATYNLTDAKITLADVDITDTYPIVLNADNKGFSINLVGLVDTANSNAGKKIVVTYKAIVTAETVNNTASAGHTGGNQFGSDTTTTYTGMITLTKYNEDQSEKLAGAGFKVTKDGATSYLKFTQDTDNTGKAIAGSYTYNPQGTIEEVITGADGTLVVKGLGVGQYHFEETTAPEGYSINAAGADATLTIEGEATSIITNTTSLNDTKLSALPATGGIGTTIFTIGGCLIMIVAAGLFFANRKKSNK